MDGRIYVGDHKTYIYKLWVSPFQRKRFLSFSHYKSIHMPAPVCVCVCRGGGGGGYSNFFRIRRLGPSIYRSPKKNIRNFKHPKKIFEILATQKISQFCTLTLKKILNCIEMTRKLAQFCNDPKKSTKSSYPPPPPKI